MNTWYINNYDDRAKTDKPKIVYDLYVEDIEARSLLNTKSVNTHIEETTQSRIKWNKLYFNIADYVLLFVPILPSHIYARLTIVIFYILMSKYYNKIKILYMNEDT